MVTNLTQTFVDSMAALVVGRTYQVWGQLLMNGQPVPTAGKTITAKIRQLRVPNASLGNSGAYDAITVIAGNPDVTALDGGMQFTVYLAQADFPVPSMPTETEPYFIEYYDADDNYTPQRVLIYLAPLY